MVGPAPKLPCRRLLPAMVMRAVSCSASCSIQRRVPRRSLVHPSPTPGRSWTPAAPPPCRDRRP
eukprot:9571288-Alexandrium_andersonii.AAC.1